MTVYADVRSYYIEKWGAPNREASFQKGTLSIGVLKWQANALTDGVNFYATIGASDYIQPGSPKTHRREFFAALAPEFDNIASPLARLGIYSQIAGQKIGAGHTYRAGHGLTDDSKLAGFVILDPPDGNPAPALLADGRHIEFLMSIPVHGDELDYASSKSVDDLIEKMGEAGAAVWNPYRKSIFE